MNDTASKKPTRYERMCMACKRSHNFKPFTEWEPDREAEPTEALQGSAAKLAVMAERARHGLPLFHDNDGGTV